MDRRCGGIVKALLSLLSFFTFIPIPSRFTLGGSVFCYIYLLPVVGLVRGLVASLPIAITIAIGVKNPLPTSFAIMAMHYVAQGFIHVDGFIDFSEAVLAHRFGVDGYKVVKDRYRGSYAIAVFTIYSLGLFSLMASLADCLDSVKMLVLLVLIEIMSTNVMMVLSHTGREPPEGFGKAFKRSLDAYNITIAITVSLALIAAFAFATRLELQHLLALVLSAASSLCISYALASKVLGFVNGDVLGFSSELFYLISMLSLWVSTWI